MPATAPQDEPEDYNKRMRNATLLGFGLGVLAGAALMGIGLATGALAATTLAYSAAAVTVTALGLLGAAFGANKLHIEHLAEKAGKLLKGQGHAHEELPPSLAPQMAPEPALEEASSYHQEQLAASRAALLNFDHTRAPRC